MDCPMVPRRNGKFRDAKYCRDGRHHRQEAENTTAQHLVGLSVCVWQPDKHDFNLPALDGVNRDVACAIRLPVLWSIPAAK